MLARRSALLKNAYIRLFKGRMTLRLTTLSTTVRVVQCKAECRNLVSMLSVVMLSVMAPFKGTPTLALMVRLLLEL